MIKIRKDVIRKIRWRVLLCTLAAILFSFIYMIFAVKAEKKTLEYHAVRQGNILKYSVDTMLLNLDTLAAMVINGEGEVDHFYEISETLMNNSVSGEAIKSLAERICEMTKQFSETKDGLPPAAFSAGVCFSRTGIDETVYKHADEALYHTKYNGRAGYTIFDENFQVLLEKNNIVKARV